LKWNLDFWLISNFDGRVFLKICFWIIFIRQAAGGSVTSVYFNRLAMREHLHPEKFLVPLKHARPPPRLMPYYLDYNNRGYLSPEIQLERQLKKLQLER